MFFSVPKSYKIKKIKQSRAKKNKIKVFNLHFDRISPPFFHLNLLVSNFYFGCAMLTEIHHTIVYIFGGILIVTVYIKNEEHLVFKCQIKII